MLKSVVGLALVGLAGVSLAGPQTYASRLQNIRVGVVVLDADHVTGGVSRAAAPHTFFNLDINTRIKPAGWSFSNPFAPGIVSPAIFSRWSAIDASLGLGAMTPAVGERIAKSDAAYWEIFLSSMTDTQLSGYDVLLVSPRFNFSLNSVEREKLRKFVDQGGTLWIDTGGLANVPDPINGAPYAFGLFTGAAGPVRSDYSQPLLSRPNNLSGRELNLLAGGPGATNNWLFGPAAASLGNLFLSIPNEQYRYQSVAYLTPDRPMVAQAKVGDGWIVVTTRGVAQKLAMTATDGTVDSNAGYRAKSPVLAATGVSAARFAVNLVNLASGYRGTGGGSRKLSSTFTSIQAPLLKRFDYLGGINPAAPPIVVKGVMLVTDGTRIYAFDANPAGDLDGDGNPDDGVEDYGLGASYDLLWVSQAMRGPISAPVAAEVVSRGGPAQPYDQVLATDVQGHLHAFSIFPYNTRGQIQGTVNQFPLYSINPPNGNADWAGKQPVAPTVSDGIAYMADTYGNAGARRGRIWQVSLRDGQILQSTGNFVLGGQGSQAALGEISASPTVGMIPIADNSGGYDRVLYAPFYPQSGGTNPNAFCGFHSVWLGVRGEAHGLPATAGATTSTTSIDTGQLVVTTRAASQGLPIWIPDFAGSMGWLAPRIYLQDAAGNPAPEATINAFLDGTVTQSDGILRFGLRNGVTSFGPWSARVDYTIDWGAITGTSNAGNVVRGTTNFPDVSPSRVVLGSMALSPEGVLHAVTTDGNGGSYYALKETGRGIYNVISRYELFGRHRITLAGGQATNYDEVLFDKDPINQFLPAANADDARLFGFSYRSAPVVRNGQVYVGAQAYRYMTLGAFGRVPIPVGLMLVFNANPQLPEIRLVGSSDDVSIIQKDFAKSNDKTAPDQDAILQSNNFTYDAARGVFQLSSLSANNRGPLLNVLNLSAPVIIRSNTGADTLVVPDATGGGRWSPLQWYATMPGFEYPAINAQSSASPSVFVSGNTVYMAGGSRAYSVLTGTGGPIPAELGMLYAVDSEIPSNDSAIRYETPPNLSAAIYPRSRPWQKQLWSIVPDGASIKANDHIRWPQLNGITNIEGFIVRLSQSVMPSAPKAAGIVGGDGVVAAWSAAGLTGFDRADFVIADQGRIGIFDSAGNPQFTTDATAVQGANAESGAAQIRPLARPTKVRPVGASDLLIVDTGANRIARTDSTGRESRSIERFVLDANFVPSGFQANAPTTFNRPMDAVTWTEVKVLSGDPVVTNQQAQEFWVHYLIADAGNRRLIELIDRYQLADGEAPGGAISVNGVPQLGVLVWQSPAAVSGNGYEYNSISRVYVGSTTEADRYVYIAGVGSSLPTRTGAGLDTNTTAPDQLAESAGGNGGVVVFDPADPKFISVVNKVVVPDTTNVAFWDERRFPTKKRFRTANDTTDGPVDPTQVASRQAHEHLFTGVASVTASVRFVNNGSGTPETQILVMVADSSGVYEFASSAISDGTALANWFLPREAYTAMRTTTNTAAVINGANDVAGAQVILGPSDSNARQFRPTYARRMDSGEILVVNGYVGDRRSYNGASSGAPFAGEVLLLDGANNIIRSASNDVEVAPGAVFNLGFGLASVRFELGPITGTRGLIMPTFADRR